MNELLIKYNSLDSVLQHQVLLFIDYLISTKNIVKTTNMSEYKKKILKVFDWSKEDIQVFNDNNKKFNQWNIPQW